MIINYDQIKTNLRNGNYKRIGAGSGRIVYDLANGYVLKVVKNKKGIAQNSAEYQIFSTNSSNLFAKIPYVSMNFDFLIMKKADKIENISYVLNYFHVSNTKELFELVEFKNIISKNNLLPADLRRHANWGIINNRPVIIDYGFTKEIRRKYYSTFL